MLATAGAIAQDLFTFPGTVETFGTEKLTKLHDAAVKKGTLGQLLFWISLFEIVSTASILQWYTAVIIPSPLTPVPIFLIFYHCRIQPASPVSMASTRSSSARCEPI